MTIARIDPPLDADERTTLTAFLDYHRATFEVKCAGLDAEQLCRRAAPPSPMSLLGLTRHLADVEKGWFDRVEFGAKQTPHYNSRPDGDFDGAQPDPTVVDDAFTTWRAEVARAQAITDRTALETMFRHEREGPMSMRWLLVHLIEEYARHNGHADLLREAIDGATGE